MATTPFQPDALDRLLFDAFPGLVMRKDLTQTMRHMSKAPSYVLEFMLGKYCADLFDDRAVQEGLALVQEEVARYIPRGDETEVIKASIRERPPRRLIDLVSVELDERLEGGVYWASLVNANIQRVNISPQIVKLYERLLTAGVWSNIVVGYDDTIRYRNQTFPFVIQKLEPVQVGRVDLEEYKEGRRAFTRDQWIDVLIRTMGYEPTHPALTQRVKLLYLVRLIPLVENNYHLIELGPKQTGKSFCFTEFSPYGTLLAGGAITVPKLFVSNTNPPALGWCGRKTPSASTRSRAAPSVQTTTRISTRTTWRATRSTAAPSPCRATRASSSTATSTSTRARPCRPSISSSRSRPRSATTPRFMTGGPPICRAGRCPSSRRSC